MQKHLSSPQSSRLLSVGLGSQARWRSEARAPLTTPQKGHLIKGLLLCCSAVESWVILSAVHKQRKAMRSGFAAGCGSGGWPPIAPLPAQPQHLRVKASRKTQANGRSVWPPGGKPKAPGRCPAASPAPFPGHEETSPRLGRLCRRPFLREPGTPGPGRGGHWLALLLCPFLQSKFLQPVACSRFNYFAKPDVPADRPSRAPRPPDSTRNHLNNVTL